VCIWATIPALKLSKNVHTSERSVTLIGTKLLKRNCDVNFFKIGIVGGGVQLGPLSTAATNGLLCQPRVIMMMEIMVEWVPGKPKYSEKTCPSAALSTTNPTCCPDANPGRRGGKPASKRLNYGTAKLWCMWRICALRLTNSAKAAVLRRKCIIKLTHALDVVHLHVS
jgi:hypothetical protein